VPSLKVPTVFHYHKSPNKACAGKAYTNDPANNCNGWPGVTAEFCQKKCANSETSPNCPRKPCMAAVWFQSGGYCHLYTVDQCQTLEDQPYDTTFKKVGGGGARPGSPILPSTAVAPPQETNGLQSKQIPLMVAGGVGGAAAGALIMGGLGMVISSVGAQNQPAKPPPKLRIDKNTTVPPTLPPTTTTLPSLFDKMVNSVHSEHSGSFHDMSGGPVLPLACLAIVCLCGLVALVIAAILDPCQRGSRKRVGRGAELGGSVASVGSLGDSVASTGSYLSEEAAYYDGYSDGHGNSIASVPEHGGSVYTYEGGSSVGEVSGHYDYDHLPQNAPPAYNAYGYPSSVPLQTAPQVPGTSMQASRAGTPARMTSTPSIHRVTSTPSYVPSLQGSYGVQRMIYSS